MQSVLDKLQKLVEDEDIVEWNFSLTSPTEQAVGPDGARAIAQALKLNHMVQQVSLGANRIGVGGAQALMESLQQSSTLQGIDLGWNEIGVDGSKAVAEALKKNATLRRVDLRRNKIGAAGAQAVSEALKLNSTVQHLVLNRNSIGPDGAHAMAAALKVNSAVQHLNLGGNEIGVAGTQALSEALKLNSTVQYINLHNNKMNADGARAVAEALKLNSAVQHICLEQNNIGDEGALAVAEALKCNSTVRFIDLRRNGIGDGGAQSIAEALVENPMVRVDLSGNAIQDSTLLKEFQRTRSAKSLRMSDAKEEDGLVRLPLHGLFQTCGEVLPIADALQPVAQLIPDFEKLLESIEKKATQLLNVGLAQGLDMNLVSYLLLYTAESHPKEQSVYYMMCRALREQRRDLAKPWVQYIWGLLHTLKRLPPSSARMLYRGCRVAWETLQTVYQIGKEVTWYAFSSCSASLTSQEHFTGSTGDRVMFHLEMRTGIGRDIWQLSWYLAESEVLLPPNVIFKVQGVARMKDGLTMVQLVEKGMEDVIVPL